jgi:hypothetical protein
LLSLLWPPRRPAAPLARFRWHAICPGHERPSLEIRMRSWRALVFLTLAVACSSDRTSPGNAPDVPVNLSSTTLDGAVALTWDDNSYVSDPDNFEHYRVYSTSYNIAAPAGSDPCGTSWRLEGTTVAAEFVVGAMVNGVSRCFAVSAMSRNGDESSRSVTEFDTPRPDSRNQVIYPIQVRSDSSGFRFWDDDGDNVVETGELGRVRDGNASDVDFFVDRDGSGNLFLTPVRAGTGVEFYADDRIGDLTSIDVAPCLPATDPGDCATYAPTPIEAAPGFGYVFEMTAGDPFYRYGAVRVTHVGPSFLILDWAFQTDPGNPELLTGSK